MGTSIRDVASRPGGSEIYYSSRRKKSIGACCLNSVTATNLILVPLLLLTLVRQIFDFLGQIWLQIIINFFTIILIIVALFGIRQNRISYLFSFTLVALFNTFWNLVVISVHFKANDLSEDLLSLYTGATSWWHTNGPGCLPYSITNIQPSLNNIIKSNTMSGCRIDYHLIEATQAAVHGALSFMAVVICCCLMSAIRRNPNYFNRKQIMTDHIYRMNNLTNNHNKINQEPFPGASSRPIAGATNSLRRAGQKASSRSSQHSISSMRSARRRRPSASDNIGNLLPTPRGSRSSMHRSSKYGSLSSRRSSRIRDGVNDVSSLTYGTTVAKRAIGANQRTRQSSISSTEYLPSYQPPHTSNANLLSSYGELSSIDSYNNANGTKTSRHVSNTYGLKGNTNPVYQGSRSSVCSQTVNTDNYDDISYIYGGNGVSDNPYGQRSGDRLRRAQVYSQQRKTIGNTASGTNSRPSYPNSVAQDIQAETYQTTSDLNGDTLAGRSKVSQVNGATFQSFSSQHNIDKLKMKDIQNEMNNNYHQDVYETNGKSLEETNHHLAESSQQVSSDGINPQMHHHQVYSNQFRYPIYTNRAQTNSNGETPM